MVLIVWGSMRGTLVNSRSSARARISSVLGRCRSIQCQFHGASPKIPLFGKEVEAEGPSADEDEGKGGAASLVRGLSEFLLKGCSPWREAPPCADYIGPVKVARTPDGRGRGLFATQDVRAGTLLLISNPMAMSYDDPHRVLLLMRLVARAQDDPLFLKQMYCLAHTQSSQDEMEVPSMDFLASPPRSPSDYGTDVHVDPSRIMDIIMLNSFEGEFKDDNQESKTWFCGLYLIPSLINHSCHRNASRLIVGGTMILHAATDIQKGEEITITYISTVAPLELRHKSSLAMKFGFKCKCKRCIVEDSLRHSLSDVSEMYCNLHDKAFDEVRKAISLVSHPPTESSFSAVAQFRSIFDRVSSRIRSEYGLSEIERKWIMAGYSSAYLGKWLIRGYIARFSKKPAIWDDTIVEVVEALRTTIPGLPHTLSLITLIVAITQRLENKHEIGKDVFKMGLAECSGIYGNLRSDVCIKLMEKSTEVIPFF